VGREPVMVQTSSGTLNAVRTSWYWTRSRHWQRNSHIVKSSGSSG
jgi:hypothetical protein